MLFGQEALERRALGIFLEALDASKGRVDFRDFRQSCFTGNRTLYVSAASPNVLRPAGRRSERAEADGAVAEPSCALCQLASHAILDSWEVCRGEKIWKACVCHAHSIPSALPCTDDDAFAEVIFAQHRMTPGSPVMGALLHLAQARGLCISGRCGEGDVKQISYTMNSGAASVSHPHLLLEAKKGLCVQFQQRLERARDFFRSHGRCSVCYCHVACIGESSCAQRVVHVTEHFIAVVPYASMPFRVSIVPKRHSASWLRLPAAELEDLVKLLQMLWKALFQILDDPSYRMFILSADFEDELDEEGLSFHWTLELQPQLLDHGCQLSRCPGLRVANQLPEACAEMLRQALARRPSETWMVDDL